MANLKKGALATKECSYWSKHVFWQEDNRHFDKFEILKTAPEFIGIGIDEKTVNSGKGNGSFEVIGENWCYCYEEIYSKEGFR